MSTSTSPRYRLGAIGLVLIFAMAALGSVMPSTSAQETWGVSWRQEDIGPLLRGGTFEIDLTVTNSMDRAVDLRIEARPAARGEDESRPAWGDGHTWVDLGGVDELTVPASERLVVSATIRVPADAANGVYGALVAFLQYEDPNSTSSGGASAQVLREVGARLFIEVSGEEQKKIESRSEPRVRDAEEEGLWIVEVELENRGNVIANPHIEIEVWDQFQTGIIRTYWFNDTQLAPGESGFYPFRIQRMDLPQGQYWTKVNVYLDGQVVKQTGSHTWDVLEEGAFKRVAVLQTIRIGDGSQLVADAGDTIQLTAVWRNDGEAPVVGQFKGTVLLDGKVIGEISSDAIEIDIGQTGELVILYLVEEPGRYEIQGRVHYGNKVTEAKSAIIEVHGGPGLMSFLVGLGGLLLVGLFIFLIVWRRRRKEEEEEGAMAHAKRRKGSSGRDGSKRAPPSRGRPAGAAPPPAKGGTRRGAGAPRGRPPQGSRPSTRKPSSSPSRPAAKRPPRS